MRRAGAVFLLLTLGQPAMAASPPAPGSPPAAASRDDRLKGAFEALTEADRRALQSALLWTGDFVGVVNGLFGPRTRDALVSFARKSDVAPEGVLDPKSRTRLLATGAAARDAVGFGSVKDAPAGVVVSLPTKLLPRRTPTEGGTHYASADGGIVVDTLSRPAGPGGLAEVFERMSGATGTRKVTYKLLRPEFFVVSGEIGERKFYSRFVVGTLEGQVTIRGVTLAYPKADAARMDTVALAAAASFDAFPSTTAQAAPGSAAAVPPVPPVRPPAPPATFALTGIRVASDAVLTHVPAQSCMKPSIGGAPVVLRKRDAASGLALFTSPPSKGALPAFSTVPARSDVPLVVLFAREPDGLAVAPAEVRPTIDVSIGGLTVSAGLQGRAEGTPLVDDEGRLHGLLSEPRYLAPSVAGTRLQADYPLIEASRLKAFLDDAGVAASGDVATPPKSLGAVAALWRPMLSRIVCEVAATP